MEKKIVLVEMVKWREDGHYEVCGNRRGKQSEIDYEIMSEFLHISMQLTTRKQARKKWN